LREEQMVEMERNSFQGQAKATIDQNFVWPISILKTKYFTKKITIELIFNFASDLVLAHPELLHD
jgi:hypothetical protein